MGKGTAAIYKADNWHVDDGYRKGSPTDCLEAVQWNRPAPGGQRNGMRLWSYEGHAEGVEDLKPLTNRKSFLT
jgi:hypothetical protein